MHLDPGGIVAAIWFLLSLLGFGFVLYKQDRLQEENKELKEQNWQLSEKDRKIKVSLRNLAQAIDCDLNPNTACGLTLEILALIEKGDIRELEKRTEAARNLLPGSNGESQV